MLGMVLGDVSVPRLVIRRAGYRPILWHLMKYYAHFDQSRIRNHVANYSDGLIDMDLPEMIRRFRGSRKIASFVSSPPSQSFHLVDSHLLFNAELTDIFNA